MHGFGPVPVHAPSRASEPWSARMWAINQILIDRGLYNFDHYRHAIERMDPADYLASTSDVRRLVAVETLLQERQPAAADPARPRMPVGAGPPASARFAPGDAVTVK